MPNADRIADRTAAVAGAAPLPVVVPLTMTDVPEAAARFRRAAWLSPCPAKSASAAASAVAIRTVTATTLSTSQCVAMRASRGGLPSLRTYYTMAWVSAFRKRLLPIIWDVTCVAADPVAGDSVAGRFRARPVPV